MCTLNIPFHGEVVEKELLKTLSGPMKKCYVNPDSMKALSYLSAANILFSFLNYFSEKIVLTFCVNCLLKPYFQ